MRPLGLSKNVLLEHWKRFCWMRFGLSILSHDKNENISIRKIDLKFSWQFLYTNISRRHFRSLLTTDIFSIRLYDKFRLHWAHSRNYPPMLLIQFCLGSKMIWTRSWLYELTLGNKFDWKLAWPLQESHELFAYGAICYWI